MRSLDLRQARRAILPFAAVVSLTIIFTDRQTQNFDGRKF